MSRDTSGLLGRPAILRATRRVLTLLGISVPVLVLCPGARPCGPYNFNKFEQVIAYTKSIANDFYALGAKIPSFRSYNRNYIAATNESGLDPCQGDVRNVWSRIDIKRHQITNTSTKPDLNQRIPLISTRQEDRWMAAMSLNAGQWEVAPMVAARETGNQVMEVSVRSGQISSRSESGDQTRIAMRSLA